MKKFIYLFPLILMNHVAVIAQGQPEKPSTWEFNSDVNFYFIPDEFFVLPVIKADKDKLHLGVRYNYEELETFSLWLGYNIQGGDEFEYFITPMIGGVAGVANGIAPGLEMTLAYKRFALYTESEYMFDFEIENYFYNWSDLTYSPLDWLWVGISGQRTRVFQNDLEIQRGLLVGGGFKNFELSTYLYDIATDDAFVLVTLSAYF